MNSSHPNDLRSEKGMVVLVVTIVIILVLSLLTIGFADLVKREQRKVLDRQLSSQAFYAAEAGVNDARQALLAGYSGDRTACAPDATFTAAKSTLSSVGPIQYSCLLISQAPTTLEYGSVSTDHSIGVPINSLDGAINTIEVSWQDEQGQTNFATTFPSFPQKTDPTWTSNTGVLRLALTPMPGTAGSLGRSNLINNTFSAFLYPSPGSGIGSVPYAGGSANQSQQGPIVDGQCNSTNVNTATQHFRYCNVNINVSSLSLSNYFLRIKSFYNTSTVTVTAYNTGGTQVRLSGAQAVVDSTGKANDVLRRIQVRIPIRNDYNYPEASLDSGLSLCKRFYTTPGSTTPDAIDSSCDLN